MMGVSTDIMYRLLVQGVSEYAIYMLDAQGTVINWNMGAERAKGYTAAEIVGQNYACFYSADDRAAGLPQRNLAIALREGRLRTEGWRCRKDGTMFWASVTIEAISDTEGKFLGFAKVTRDLTEQHELMIRIAHQATHDGLTGILNRAGLLAHLTQALRTGRALALHCLDLDHFKPVNDRFGHIAGDAVLREVAQRLRMIAGDGGHVGRLGGDEFAIVQHDVAGGRDASPLAEMIVSRLGTPIDIGDAEVTVGASVGVACSPEGGSDATTLMRNADHVLYDAKGSGRNCVRLFRAA